MNLNINLMQWVMTNKKHTMNPSICSHSVLLWKSHYPVTLLPLHSFGIKRANQKWLIKTWAITGNACLCQRDIVNSLHWLRGKCIPRLCLYIKVWVIPLLALLGLCMHTRHFQTHVKMAGVHTAFIKECLHRYTCACLVLLQPCGNVYVFIHVWTTQIFWCHNNN